MTSTSDYVEQRIKEALRVAGGNKARARQQLIAWTYEDAKLLHALARPHLNGIVAYNIDRVASGRSAKAKQAPKPANKPQVQEEDNFGMEILKAVSGNSGAVFGLEDSGSAPRKRGQTSQSHIDAIRRMASTKLPKKKE